MLVILGFDLLFLTPGWVCSTVIWLIGPFIVSMYLSIVRGYLIVRLDYLFIGLTIFLRKFFILTITNLNHNTTTTTTLYWLGWWDWVYLSVVTVSTILPGLMPSV